ncbi:hypothetical protein [Enterovibrio baiacu]|uniref:hypothetical protein n=1 Tax=Enterovibrio baiacu TaxID=2491023 RepID=UPI0010102350|nr:hypothetical protein [Enterovibrio baiacu]MBE1275026.1 hypothetical protein [Enterovibrio baiacu]
MKKTITLLSTLLFAPLALSNANEGVKILAFLMDEVEICDKDYACADIDKKLLPDPEKSPIFVTSYDESEGMLEFFLNNDKKWVHQTEVELNQKAVASVICTNQKISRKSDKEVFATYGLGEGC